MKTNTNEVLSYLAVASGSTAVLDPALIAAVGGPKAVAVALLIKGVLGAATEQLKRMKAKETP
jgi:hypothetical protein